MADPSFGGDRAAAQPRYEDDSRFSGGLAAGSLPERKDMTASMPKRAAMRPRRRLTLLLAGAAAISACFVALTASPANAAALTNMSWTVSNNQVASTNVSYAYSFKTTTAGTIKTITFAVSGAGLAGAPTITRAYGIGAGTVARVGQTITYTVTAAVAIPAGIPIYIEFAGLTNS